MDCAETDQPGADCCETMRRGLTGCFDRHPRRDCPDFLFDHDGRFDEWRSRVLGQPWAVTGRHRPLCGARFTGGKRGLWFDRREAMGFDGPVLDRDRMPDQQKSAAWRKDLEC